MDAGAVLNTPVGSLTLNQAFRVQIRRRGADPWIKLPEVHFTMNITDPFQKVIRIKWGAKPVGVLVPPTNQGPVFAFKHVPGQDGATAIPATPTWTADASFSAGSGGDLLFAGNILAGSKVLNTELYADKVIFYLDPVAFPAGPITRSRSRNRRPITSATFSASAYASIPGNGGGFLQLLFDQGAPAIARIPEDQSSLSAVVQLTRLSSVWNENPIQSPDFATMSIEDLRASRSIDYSIMAAGLRQRLRLGRLWQLGQSHDDIQSRAACARCANRIAEPEAGPDLADQRQRVRRLAHGCNLAWPDRQLRRRRQADQRRAEHDRRLHPRRDPAQRKVGRLS